MAKAYRYTLPDMNFACEVEDGGLLPSNATYTKPEILSGFWPRWTGEAWEQIQDYRERKPPYFSEEYTQESTPFWLPAEGDTWQSQPRTMKEVGRLPAGALLSPPEQTLDELKAIKRQAFTSAFTILDQRAQRPQSTVLAALMYDTPAPEPDADFIWQMEAIKDENRRLLARLEAATTREEVEKINPWLPWNSPDSTDDTESVTV